MDRQLRVPLVTRWDFIGPGFMALFGVAGMLSPLWIEDSGVGFTVFVLISYGAFLVMSFPLLRYAWANKGKFLCMDKGSIWVERDGNREWNLPWKDYLGYRPAPKRSTPAMARGSGIEIVNTASEVVATVAVHRGGELHMNSDRHALLRGLRRQSQIPEPQPKPIVPKIRRTPLRCWVFIVVGSLVTVPSGVLMALEGARAREHIDWFAQGLKPHHHMLLLSIPLFLGLGLITAGCFGLLYLKLPQRLTAKPKSPDAEALADFLIDARYRPQPVEMVDGKTYAYRFQDQLCADLKELRATGWFIVLLGVPITIWFSISLLDWLAAPIGAIGLLMFGSATSCGLLLLRIHKKLSGRVGDRFRVRNGQLEVAGPAGSVHYPLESRKRSRYAASWIHVRRVAGSL
jgi:hypothetical protein